MKRWIGMIAVMSVVLGATAAPATAIQVDPEHGGIYAVGTEFAAPTCSNGRFPWNIPAGGPSYDEVNEWTVLIFDTNDDGLGYESLTEENPFSDDYMVYVAGPQAIVPYPWADAYDTSDCWYRQNPPYMTIPGSYPGFGTPLPHYSRGTADDQSGPEGEANPAYPNPRPDSPFVADHDAFPQYDRATGNWRLERWRETVHWVYDDSGAGQDCEDPSPTNWHCWYEFNEQDNDKPREFVRLERRDFRVEEPFVLILSGPSGEVGSPSAQFEFAYIAADPDAPGEYQCSLDGGGYSPCEPGIRYDGLADGTHTFDVRYVLETQEDDDAHVTRRQWSVDTTPPDTIIQSAPSGTVASQSATVEFISTEPDNATYRCTLDGGPEYPCSSPERLSNLSEGPHTFGVRATDRAGNEQRDPKTVSWTVQLPPPPPGGGPLPPGGGSAPLGTTKPPAASTGCKTGTVDVGMLIVVARDGACFTEEEITQTRTRYTTTGTVTINGVTVRPRAGTKLVLDQNLTATEVKLTGPVDVELGPVELPIPVGFSDTLPNTKSGKAVTLSLPYKFNGKVLELAGVDMAFAPTLELSRDDGGSAAVKLVIEAPSAFRGVAGQAKDPDSPGGLTAEFGFAASNEKGVRLAGKATIPKAYLFGKVGLTDVSLGVAYPPLEIEGSAALTFPNAPGSGDKKFALTFTWSEPQPGTPTLWGNVTKLSLQASNLAVPIGYGFFLQRVGGEFTGCNDAKGSGTGAQLAVNGGVSAGPPVNLKPFIDFEGTAFQVDGKVEVVVCEPMSVKVAGDAKLATIPLYSAEAKYTFDGHNTTTLKGGYDIALGPFAFKAGITDGWLNDKSYNVVSTGQVQLGPLSYRADGVISKTGFGFCYGDPGKRIGYVKRWDVAGSSGVTGGCDVEPLKVQAAAAQATTETTFEVPRGAPLHVADVQGAGVVLTAPDGTSVAATPEPARIGNVLVIPDGETTHFVLYDPPAGRWKATAPAPFTLRTAAARPDPGIRAKVSGRGARRALEWKLNPQPGQEVTFVERTGEAAHVLRTTSAASGRIRFAPRNLPQRARRIEAIVTQDGLPRSTTTVATFRAAPFARPRPVSGLALKRGKIRWRGQRGAQRFSVLLRYGRARTRSLETRRTSLRFRGRRVRVTIAAIGADGSVARAVTRNLRRR